MRILYCAIDQTVPGTDGGIRPRDGGGRRARGARPRGARARDAGPGRLSRTGRRRTGSRCRRRSGRKELRWARCRRRARDRARRCSPTSSSSGTTTSAARGSRRGGRVGAPAVLEVNAPVIDYPGSPKQRLDRALIVEPMRRWRERICAQRRSDRHAERRHPAAAARRPSKIVELEWGADTDRFHPGATGGRAVRAARRHGRGLRRRVPPLARRDAPGARDARAACARATRRRRRCSSATARNCRAVREAAAGLDGVVFTGAVPHDAMPACLAAADIGVAPFDVGAHRAAGARLLLVAAEDLRVHGRRAAGRRAGIPRLAALVERRTRGPAVRPAADPRAAWPPRWSGCADPRTLRQRLGARRRATRVRPRLQLGRRTAARSSAATQAALQRPDRALTRERPHRHRRVSARLRRQRLEHVRARARPPARGHARHRRAAAAGHAARASRETAYDGFRVLRVRRVPRRRCRTSATTSRTSGCTRARRLPRRRSSRASGSTSCTAQHVLTCRARRSTRPARAGIPSSARCATTGRSATGPI